MAGKHPIRAHWGLLIAAYWAVLIPTALVVLTSGTNVVPFLALLAVGVPVYFVAANALVDRCVPQEPTADAGSDASASAVIVPFPKPRPGVDTPDLAARRDVGRLRKLG